MIENIDWKVKNLSVIFRHYFSNKYHNHFVVKYLMNFVFHLSVKMNQNLK